MSRSVCIAAWVTLACTFFQQTASAQMTTSGVIPGAQGWYLATGDGSGELFVFEVGSGEPVVVLHGGPGADLTYTLPMARGLVDDLRFVFYDQRGSLRSRVNPDSISMAKHVEDLETLRVALGLERMNILSHSAGTLLAFEYLREHPHRVANVALVGALPHKNGAAYFDAEYAELWRSLSTEAEQFWNRDALRQEVERAGLHRDSLTPREESMRALIQQVGAETFHVERWTDALPMRVNPEASRRTRESTDFEYDYTAVLAAHPFPVTVINGEFDYTVGPRDSPLWRRLSEEVPQVRVEVISEASHIVWRDAPDQFREALRAALTR